MYRVTSEVLNEDVLFLSYNEKKEVIDNPDKLVVYSYPELCLIQEMKPDKEELKEWHKLKKEFDGVIERRTDGISKSFKRSSNPDGRGTYSENECSAAAAFNPTKSVSISTNVFEFFEDYRKFRDARKIAGG